MDFAPHRRFNPLNREWVLVSPQRSLRPWQGEVAPAPASESTPAYDPDCPLCPGNCRSNGTRNPDFKGVFVFENDFPAMLPNREEEPSGGLLRSEPVAGKCLVVCYSEDHSASLSTLPRPGLQHVVQELGRLHSELAQDFEWVQIFENRGAMMGASSPHPHFQIWAMDTLPTQPAKIAESFATHPSLLAEVMIEERNAGERVLFSSEHAMAWVPFWAAWPFEVMVAPIRPVRTLSELNPIELEDLCGATETVLGAYDRLFQAPFPYSFGWMNAPASRQPWHLFGHFLPPLLRSASIRKHMVGFELLCEPQRDLTPEAAAARLRDLIDS